MIYSCLVFSWFAVEPVIYDMSKEVAYVCYICSGLLMQLSFLTSYHIYD